MAKRTAFHEIHVRHGAVMAERSGWEVASHYGDAEGEYQRCVEHVGVIDTSWQYRVRINGKGAGHVLDSVLAEPISTMPRHHHRRTLTRAGGDGVSDEILVQHQDKGYVAIGDPHGHGRLLARLNEAAAMNGGGIEISDETEKTAMVTLVGPSAWRLLSEKLPFEIDHVESGQLTVQNYLFFRFVISREGRLPWPAATIILPAKMAGMAWEMLEKYGRGYQATLAGAETLERINKKLKAEI
jgi:glycine cleavage system aminomethyltransferase T